MDDFENEVERRKRLLLDKPNEHLSKYPALKDCTIIVAAKDSKSVLDICGVRVKERIKGTPWFVCLSDGCFAAQVAIKLSVTSTYNGTNHCTVKHNMSSSKTEAHKRNSAVIANSIQNAEACFKADPRRWFEVNLAAFACENTLSYRAFDSPFWKVIASKLPVGNSDAMTSINIRKHYVEHYVTVKNKIIKQIQEAREYYCLPYLSLSLDLIQNEVQNKKLIGLRVTYSFQGCSVSHNLAVRGYNPTERQMTSGIPASELLITWTKMILQEFSINAEADILTSCTDSGSDVKKALEKVLPTLREWCISHLSHLALADAFGSSLDPAKSRNIEVRDLLNQCRKVVEKN